MQALAEIAARQALRIEMRRLPFELLRRPPSAIHERSSPPLFAPFSCGKGSPRESCRPSCPPLGVSRPGPASLSLDLLDLDLLVLDLLDLDLLDLDLLDLDLLDLDLLDLDLLDFVWVGCASAPGLGGNALCGCDAKRRLSKGEPHGAPRWPND